MVKDKMNLPFEVTYSEEPSSKSRTMKRLAVLVKPENVDAIVTALRDGGLDATIYDVKGARDSAKEGCSVEWHICSTATCVVGFSRTT